MKYLFYIFFVFISVNTFSQSDNPCEVDGVEVVASMFYFEPQNISVNLGQTVYWLNIQGFHDVNAVNNTLTNEPFNNPEPFILDAIQGNSSGVCIGYHTFNVPGIYNYDCSIYGHALNGMVGTIEVGIGGCMDQSADNYDENAEYDNGTCCYIGELSTDILPALCSDDIASLNILSSSIYNFNYEVLNFELSNTTGQFDLDEGEYDILVNITDSQCYDTITISIPPPPEEINILVETVDILCHGDSSGSIVVTASGGTGDFLYSNDNINYSDENQFGNLLAGEHVIYIQDENACETTFLATIAEPSEEITLIVETIDATATQNGSGIAIVSGGTGELIIEWFDATGNNVSPDSLQEGTYYVSATDENSCSETVSFDIIFNSVNQLNNPVFNFFPNPTSGKITFEAINSLDYIYLLNSFGQKVLEVDTGGKEKYELDISSLKPGIYYVSAKNICKKLILK